MPLLTDYPTISLFLLQQTEIAKRLNAILAQIMPFLSQEVSLEPSLAFPEHADGADVLMASGGR